MPMTSKLPPPKFPKNHPKAKCCGSPQPLHIVRAHPGVRSLLWLHCHNTPTSQASTWNPNPHQAALRGLGGAGKKSKPYSCSVRTLSFLFKIQYMCACDRNIPVLTLYATALKTIFFNYIVITTDHDPTLNTITVYQMLINSPTCPQVF